jgi:hypothetical protein
MNLLLQLLPQSMPSFKANMARALSWVLNLQVAKVFAEFDYRLVLSLMVTLMSLSDLFSA